MAKPVTHFSRIRTVGGRTITGTLCNRMTAGEINCSTDTAEVTCKFCIRELASQARPFCEPVIRYVRVAA